ncbi:tetratricopeptide repeat protein [Lichenicoccus sp.]|uniref:tetratricopeptide repeat protein n=1 Tax=Lichenicoccus sp. TaxID=2781899 RepID=UPI003D0F5DC1
MSLLRAIQLGLLRLRGRPAVLVDHAQRLAARGDHRRAMELLARAAQAGSSAACFELGRAYLFGRSAPACPAVAMRWLAEAARGGEIEAQFMVASLALQGVAEAGPGTLFELASHVPSGIPDYQAAQHWAEIAAAAGHAPSQALLGFILTSGPQALRDVRRGEACYRLAADAGCAHGQLGWSLALLRQDPVANGIEAQRLLAQAARANMPVAHYMLGVLAGAASVAAGSADASAEHYRAGAQLGHGPSQLAYGLALLRGHGVEPDAFLGECWIRRAALCGEVQAEAALGELYGQSGALPPNHAEAMLWFGRAAASGHTGAARALARLHLRGEAVGADRREARHLLRVAAAQGDAAACEEFAAIVLADAGSRESGIPPGDTREDWRVILDRFRDMAAQGDPAAAYNAGLCYAAGLGMEADQAQALVWFRLAADRLPIAQYSCGRMLAEGRGVAQDLPAARRYLLQASDQGLPDAEALAAEMLLNGRGGPTDPATAKALFRHAAEAGHLGALYALGMLALGFYDQPEDLEAAGTFLRKAAASGHPGALAALSYSRTASVQEGRNPDAIDRSRRMEHAGAKVPAAGRRREVFVIAS